MSDRNDGGPAFPAVIGTPDDFLDGALLPLGMSQRDYYAGQALMGILAQGAQRGRAEHKREIAETCFALADAMLEAQRK